ncbi:MAG: agmatine deiminase [Verrucomicrobiales bacterium]|nr:agmatine deiminase [Verrucomicrobiales bacterium]|tara:strand:+ start:413 stop:1420 length:1008 start_codon:yes stop_codon:yes gene_type:complete
MPAEWESHAATWLTWPWPGGCSFPDNYDAIIPAYAQLIHTLVPHETVKINVWDSEMESWVRQILDGYRVPLDKVEFHHNPAYEPWCRDHGPVFVIGEDGRKQIVDWEYNAWGEKYPPWDKDNEVPRRIATDLNLPVLNPGMILEGGSIETDGKGTILTTESCLLNPNRNPGLSRTEIENRLCTFLGAQRVLWLGDGIAGDDTDGHIDDLARFTDAHTIVTVVKDDPEDENYEALQDNFNRLKSMKDLQGNPYRIIKLPCPSALYWKETRMPCSYANFYIANGLVLVPTFGDPNDEPVLATLRFLFPNRDVVGMDSSELITGQGAIHCITQQEPAE